MKNVSRLLTVSLVVLSFQMVKSAEADESQFEQNRKNANEVYQRQEAAKERQRYQDYLKNKDRESGISQQSGPTGGRTSDGQDYWGGYKWSTK
ncbi:MAG: hypothetical protein AB7G75_03745 [Candidatus Binatia bacterium]